MEVKDECKKYMVHRRYSNYEELSDSYFNNIAVLSGIEKERRLFGF